MIAAPSHRPITKHIRRRSRQLRSSSTISERRLWNHLKHTPLFNQYHFRRQHPIKRYIVDFFCARAKLVIEVDGQSHDQTTQLDAKRDQALQLLGYTVLRVTNDAVMKNIDGVLQQIVKLLPPPLTPPFKGEGEER